MLIALGFSFLFAGGNISPITTTHRVVIDKDSKYVGTVMESSTYTFYITNDTSDSWYFLHQTPEIASKYYLVQSTLKMVPDSGFMEVLAKSDAGNLYAFLFNFTSKLVRATKLNIVSQEPFKLDTDFTVIWITK